MLKRKLMVLVVVSVLVLAVQGSVVLAQEPGETEVPALELSGTGISALVAVITSVLLAYIPGFAGWWESCLYKRELLGALGLVVAIALAGLHYAGAVDLGLGAFGWPVVGQIIESWLVFSGAGQLSYTAQKRTGEP